MEKITAHGLAKVAFHGDVKDDTIAMALEDSEGQNLAVAVNAQTIRHGHFIWHQVSARVTCTS